VIIDWHSHICTPEEAADDANVGPAPPITLRQGARVIEDSRRLRVASGRLSG
jgi:hypothetical protein